MFSSITFFKLQFLDNLLLALTVIINVDKLSTN
jgi:hypothetical protein